MISFFRSLLTELSSFTTLNHRKHLPQDGPSKTLQKGPPEQNRLSIPQKLYLVPSDHTPRRNHDHQPPPHHSQPNPPNPPSRHPGLTEPRPPHHQSLLPHQAPPTSETDALYVSTNLRTYHTNNPDGLARDLNLNGICYRRLVRCITPGFMVR